MREAIFRFISLKVEFFKDFYMTKKKKGIILYAEDDENLRKVYSMAWKRYFPAYSVEQLPDGGSLERRLAKDITNVRLVITDDQMPNVRGSKIIEDYARKERFRHIPFILLYAGEPSIGRIAVRNGAFAYLDKGRFLDDLVNFIGKALKTSESIASSQ